jgi:polysaccharide chain length determinant protein (PEP-CTERM system associated)
MAKPRVLTPQDYLGMLRRRWKLIVLPAVAGLTIGYGLIRILPKRYTSQSLILVERQQVPHSFVEPVITDDLNARIANIEEQTLSRTRLQPLIERYGLFKNDAAGKSMDDLVLLTQKAVTLTPVEPMVKTKEQIVPGFYLAVTLEDPRIAQQVCADISSMFIDEDIRQRQRSAEGTTSFLQTQLDDAKRKLDEQDGILANFERKYMGMLPDEEKTNLGMLGTLNTQLQALTDNLNRATQDKAYMESLLAQQLQAWKLTTEMEGGQASSQGSDPVADRLTKLQAELTSLQAHYTDEYPDVVKVKAEIADLKKQISAATDPSSGNGAKDASTGSALEPPEIQKLRGQLRSLEQAVKTDTQEQEQLKAAIKSYESRLQLSPAVEEEYKKITRDHETALKFYNDLLGKRDESQMATELERRQEGEQLRVMDPANLPDQPSFPKLTTFLGGGFGAGLALGLALVLGLGTADKRIRTTRDVQFYLGTTAFALIPSIEITATSLMGRNGTKKTESPKKLIEA